MEPRKLQVVGNRSFSLSLPKQWVTDNKLKNHDLVYIQRTANNELLLTSKQETASIDVVTQQANAVSAEFLVFCYMKNKTKVIFKGTSSNPLTYEHKRDIRQVLEYLEGFEITAEDDSHIEVSFVFGNMQVTAPVIVKRMLYLLKLQAQALISSDERTLRETEMSLNRLYYLGTRIIFGCLADAKRRLENQIESDEEIFFQQQLLKRLEHIGDRIIRCSESKIKDVAQVIPMLAFVEKTLLAKDADIIKLKGDFESITIKSKDETSRFHLHRLLDLCKDVYDVKLSLTLNRIIG